MEPNKNQNILYSVGDLRFSYTLGTHHFEVLHGITMEIQKGDIICFSGPSGSGKTTFLNILGLIEPLQKGRVSFCNQEFQSMSERQKNQLRRHHIGFIFQRFHLLPILDAEENVEFFLARQGVSYNTRKTRVREALELVGLWEHRKKKPWEMSGGQRQRVAIARAFAKNPDVIIADEPTASLDQKTGREVMDIMQVFNQEKGTTFLLASHDPMVHHFAKTQYHLSDGKLYNGAFKET